MVVTGFQVVVGLVVGFVVGGRRSEFRIVGGDLFFDCGKFRLDPLDRPERRHDIFVEPVASGQHFLPGGSACYVFFH